MVYGQVIKKKKKNKKKRKEKTINFKENKYGFIIFFINFHRYYK